MTAGKEAAVDVRSLLTHLLREAVTDNRYDDAEHIAAIDAAVAELMERVDRATVDRPRIEYDEGPAVYEIAENDWIAIRAALARCGGAQA